jgi:hypothetical protein
MPRKQLAVLSCIEHERLEFELIEVRTRGAIPDPASQAVARRAGRLGPAGAAGAFESRGSRTGAWVQRLKLDVAKEKKGRAERYEVVKSRYRK